jgi:hypothetical protein
MRQNGAGECWPKVRQEHFVLLPSNKILAEQRSELWSALVRNRGGMISYTRKQCNLCDLVICYICWCHRTNYATIFWYVIHSTVISHQSRSQFWSLISKCLVWGQQDKMLLLCKSDESYLHHSHPSMWFIAGPITTFIIILLHTMFDGLKAYKSPCRDCSDFKLKDYLLWSHENLLEYWIKGNWSS